MALTRRQALAALFGSTLGPAALGGLSGCSTGRLTDEDTLSLWYWDRSISDTLLAQVPKEVGVKLKPTKVSLIKTKLITSLAGQAYIPDITAFNENIATYFPDEDQFIDLNDLGARDLEGDYLDWKWQRGITPNNRFVGFPMDTGPTALFYRADIFKAAGLPTEPSEVEKLVDTWEKYFDVGEQIVERTNKESYLFDQIFMVYDQHKGQQAKRYMTEDDKYIGRGAHIRRGWDLAIEAHKRGITARVPLDSADWNAAVQTGRFATLVDAVWRGFIIEDTAPKTAGKWRVCRAPGGAGNVGGSFLGIPKASVDPEKAFEVIKWLQSPVNQVKAYNEIQLFPSARSALESNAVSEPEKFYGGQQINDVFVESAEQVKPVYLSAYDDLINAGFQNELANVWTGGKDPEAAWRDAQAQAESQLEKRGLL